MSKIKYTHISIILMIMVFFGGILFISKTAIGGTMSERLKGYILLQVEQNGESWYVSPSTQNRIYLGRPTHAFDIMRYQGLGITNVDLNKIPRAGMDDVGDINLQQRLSGYILLQVELNGEAWYVYPNDLHRYYLGRPDDAFSIMRELGLGIIDSDLTQVTTDPNSMDLITDDTTSDTTDISPDTSSNDSADQDSAEDETPPVLTNFMVNFGTYNASTGKAGDYYFEPNIDKVFGEFERTVIGPEGPKTLPSYDYFVATDTAIVSPLAGVVSTIIYQESTLDYEIFIQSSSNNVWIISIDHIQNLSAYITEGANVTAGQYLGKASPWVGDAHMIELMIFKDVSGSATAYCPYDFFSSTLKTSFVSGLNTLMSDWETFKGDSSIYDESAFIQPGCLADIAAG